MIQRLLLAVVVGALLPARAIADVRIGVLGLLHPRELSVRAADAGGLVLRSDNGTCAEPGRGAARLTAVGGLVRAICGGRVIEARRFSIASPVGGPARIEVSVPGTLVRTFRGLVDVATSDGELSTSVTMEIETAVASVVSSELPDGTPLEALKALAVAARSYFVARHARHRGFDFCDTTHCQFLRDAPPRDHPAARAAAETRGVVLAFDGAPVAALHSGSCGGRTRSLAEAGLTAGRGYPYFSVPCPYCQRESTHWERRIALDDETRQLDVARSEAARIAIGRRQGWAAVPSNHFEASREDGLLVLRGRGAGHGIGLCQLGAAGRAAAGETFVEILAAYYPGTTVTSAANRRSREVR